MRQSRCRDAADDAGILDHHGAQVRIDIGGDADGGDGAAAPIASIRPAFTIVVAEARLIAVALMTSDPCDSPARMIPLL